MPSNNTKANEGTPSSNDSDATDPISPMIPPPQIKVPASRSGSTITIPRSHGGPIIVVYIRKGRSRPHARWCIRFRSSSNGFKPGGTSTPGSSTFSESPAPGSAGGKGGRPRGAPGDGSAERSTPGGTPFGGGWGFPRLGLLERRDEARDVPDFRDDLPGPADLRLADPEVVSRVRL